MYFRTQIHKNNISLFIYNVLTWINDLHLYIETPLIAYNGVHNYLSSLCVDLPLPDHFRPHHSLSCVLSEAFFQFWEAVLGT